MRKVIMNSGLVQGGLPLTSLSAGIGCRMDGLGIAIMMVLRGSVLIASDQSNFKVGKRNTPKSTVRVIYKHDRDRELQVGAGAKGRTKATLDFSHTH